MKRTDIEIDLAIESLLSRLETLRALYDASENKPHTQGSIAEQISGLVDELKNLELLKRTYTDGVES